MSCRVNSSQTQFLFYLDLSVVVCVVANGPKRQVIIGLTPLMEYDDPWPLTLAPVTDSDRESALCHISLLTTNIVSWPWISICDHVIAPPPLQSVGADSVEEVSVMSDDYLADRKPFCLRGYLAAWRGDDVSGGGGGGRKTIHSHCVQLWSVPCRCTHGQIQTNPMWHLISQNDDCHDRKMSCSTAAQPEILLTHISMRLEAGSLGQTLPPPSTLQYAFSFPLLFHQESTGDGTPPQGPHHRDPTTGTPPQGPHHSVCRKPPRWSSACSSSPYSLFTFLPLQPSVSAEFCKQRKL